MAAKVNTKFVVALIAGTVVVFGTVYAAYAFLLKNTPERLVAAGNTQLKVAETLRTEGKPTEAQEAVEKAIGFYSKAVNKEQTNVELLRKWGEALAVYAPSNPVVYQASFRNDFMTVRRQTAVLLRTDVAAHREFLDILYKQTSNASINPEVVIRAVEDMKKYFDEASDPKEKAGVDGILRYRGIALLRQVTNSTDAPASSVETAQADLEAALRYDPKDDVAAESLYSLHMVEADRAAAQARTADFDADRAKAYEVANKFLEANPRNAMMTLALAHTRFVDKIMEIRKITSREANAAAQAKFREEMLPVLEDTMAAFEETEPTKIDPNLIQTLASMESTIDPNAKLRRSVALASKLETARPSDPEVLIHVADLAARSQDFERAITEAQKIVSAPVKPISLEGIKLFELKRVAAAQQAAWAMDIAETTADKDARAKVVERAKKLRDVYAGFVEASDPQLKMVDGRIAFAEERTGEASRLFKEYNDAVRDSDPKGLLYASMAALSRSNPDTGYAKERLEHLLTLDPSSVVAYLQLTRIDMLNMDREKAETHIKAALALDPENKLAKDLLTQIQNGGGSDDPVATAILAALKKGTPGHEQQVTEDLRKALADYPGEPRIVLALARQLLWSGDREGALATVDAGLSSHPDDQNLKQFKTVMTSKDELATALTLIDESSLPPLQKLIRRYAAFRSANKETEALAALEQAEKEFPESPEVVEMRFLWALDKQQWEVANRMMDLAASKNMDNADGLTFRSRLQAARGQVDEALASVEAALRLVPANTEMFRLQGKLLGMGSRLEESVAAFKKAVDARPTDPGANRDYVSMLLAVGRMKDALDQCRRNPRVTASDPELTSMWLGLEASYGDRTLAVTSRERAHNAQPQDRTNTLALADLYVGDKRYADAMKLIEEAKAQKDGLDVAGVEAKCLDAQQKFDEAKAVYARLVSSSDASVSMNASVNLSGYMIARGDIDGGIQVMEAARAKQDPKVAEIDRVMTQMFDRLGKPDRAIESARRVIEATGDPDGAFRKQIVRTMLRMGNYDDADKEYAGLVPLESKDPEALLLKADTKLARGDKDGAKFILDDAVARFPQSTIVYNVRGTFLFTRMQKAREGVADFTKSLAINPMQVQVLMSRARAYVSLEMVEEALADLKKVVALQPGDPAARKTYLTNLLDLGMVDQAVEAGREMLRLNNGSADVAMEIGTIFGSGYQKWEQSALFYKEAYDSTKSAESAAELVVACLKQLPPKLTDAGTILRETHDKFDTSWPLLLSRARWQAAQSDKVGARASLTQGLTLMGTDNFERLKFWFQVTRELMPDAKECGAYLEQLERAGTAPQYVKWFRASLLARDAATLEQGIAMLKECMDPSIPAALRLENFRLLGSIFFSLKRYEEGLGTNRIGLEQFPDDPDLLNNTAYVLAKYMNKGEEALPIAKHAVEVAPNSPDAFDTYGYVLMLNKQYQDAGRSMEASFRLANMAGSFRAEVIAIIHLGQLYVEMGDKVKAKQMLEEAQNRTNQVPAQAKEFEADLADLAKKVE